MHTLKVISRGRLIHAEQVETAELVSPPVFEFWCKAPDITEIKVSVDVCKVFGNGVGFRDVDCTPNKTTRVHYPQMVTLDWCGRPMVKFFTKDGEEFHP